MQVKRMQKEGKKGTGKKKPRVLRVLRVLRGSILFGTGSSGFWTRKKQDKKHLLSAGLVGTYGCAFRLALNAA
jgi:hypothetical protein